MDRKFSAVVAPHQWLKAIALAVGLFGITMVLLIGGVVWPYWHSSYQVPDKVAPNPKVATPPMGWNSWNSFGCRSDYNEQNIKKTIDVMVTEGYLASGYRVLVLDDCWQVGRDENGKIIADAERFPSGIAALAAYARERGLQFGIYTSAGRLTCEKKPGSYGYEKEDLATYADWGVDFIKLGWCGIENLDVRSVYQKWRTLIDEQFASNRADAPIVSLAINQPSTAFNPEVWLWGRQVGGMWRTTIDLEDNWEDVLAVYDLASIYAPYQQVGGFNDADVLRVGGVLSPEEYRTHFGLWAMMSTPLFISTDLTALSSELRSLVQNRDAIAINQDRLGIQAETIWEDDHTQIISKPLSQRGSRAVLLVNRGEGVATITVSAKQLRLLPLFFSKNIWAREYWRVQLDTQEFEVPPHGSELLLVKGIDTFSNLSDYTPDLVDGVVTGNLTTQTSVFSQGLFEYDAALATGQGMGVKSESSFRYHLNRRCTDFITQFEYLGQGKTFATDQGMIVEVYVDGTLVAQQTMDADRTKTDIKVSLSGARVLDLVTRSKPGSQTTPHYGRWTLPQVICPGKNKF